MQSGQYLLSLRAIIDGKEKLLEARVTLLNQGGPEEPVVAMLEEGQLVLNHPGWNYEMRVRLYGISGELLAIWTRDAPAFPLALNTPSLPRGVYLVSVEFREGGMAAGRQLVKTALR